MIPALAWDFSADPGGWTSTGSGGQWAWIDGGGGDRSGWVTQADGTYLNDSLDYLTSPTWSVAAADGPNLQVAHRFDVMPGDAAWFEVLRGDGWHRVTPVGGYPDPSGFVGRSAVVTSVLPLPNDATAVRMAFQTDTNGTAEGWIVHGAELWAEDVSPPLIVPTVVPIDNDDLVGPQRIQFAVYDDASIGDVTVAYAWGSVAQAPIAATPTGGALWAADLPSPPPGTRVSWSITASDGRQSSTWPDDGAATFRVALPPPKDLHAPDSRRIGSRLRLVWSPPETDRAILGYRVEERTGAADGVDAALPFADVTVPSTGRYTWVVAAEYAEGYGDVSDAFTTDVEVPTLVEVYPPRVWPGERLHATFSFQSMYLADGVTDLRAEGVVVEQVEVLDVDRLAATLNVPSDAAPGAVEVTVRGLYGDERFDAAFEIADPATRLRVEPSPTSVTQGFVGEVRVTCTAPFPAEVLVDGDADIVITAHHTAGDTVTVAVAVSSRASDGVHWLTLDDGTRLWSVPIEVEEVLPPPSRGCQTARGSGLLAFLGWFSARRRRRSAPPSRSRRG